jgi:hypothetical protein
MRIVRWSSATAWIVGVALLACGGTTPNANSPASDAIAAAHVDGRVKGKAIEPHDAIAYTIPAYQGMRILISDQAGTCGKVWKSDYKIRGIHALQIVLAEDRGAPKTTGVYLVNDGSSQRFAVGGYVAYDDQCKEVEGGVEDSDTGAVGGKVTLTDIQLEPGGHVSGTFDVTLKGGDHLVGDFVAPFCAKPNDVEGAAFNPTCQ